MEMLDRYLAEVQRNLPRDHEPDIIDEIGDSIRSQIEDRETSLGRPLTLDEEADVLRAYGNPKLVAWRYAKQQYLIGPQLLPFYWYALRLVLIVVLGLEVVAGAIAGIVMGSVGPFFAGLDAAWHSVIYIFGIITIIFAVIERAGSRAVLEKLDRWDPRKLPAPDTMPRVSRGKTAIEFIANTSMLIVTIEAWRGSLQAFIAPFMLTGAWRVLYVALIIACSMVALAAVAVYIRPMLGKVQLVARVLASGVTLSGVGLALRSGTLVTAHAGAVSTTTLATVNTIVEVNVIIFMAAVAITAAVDVWKLIRATTLAGSAASSSALAL